MRVHAVLLAGIVAVTGAASAGAQPIARADVTGVVGWFNANQPGTYVSDDWYNHSAYGGAGLGWYWTDHLKSEVEAGATSGAELYAYEPVDVDGQRLYVTSRRRFRTRRVAIAQQYQFLRNAWVHPHAGAGLDVTWATREQRLEAVTVYDPASRTNRVVRPAGTIGPSTEVDIRPFAEVGSKFYVSRRGFFRTDLRLTWHSGIDEVVARFGFGVDF